MTAGVKCPIWLRKLFIKKTQPLETSTIVGRQLYTSINELPLNIFIDCSVTGNLASLIITGNATEDELLDAWETIVAQYRIAIRDREYKHYLIQLKHLARLEIDFECVLQLISLLQTVYDRSLCDKLNKLLQASFSFDPSNHEKYLKDLERCSQQANGLGLRLEIKEAEVKHLHSKLLTGDKPDKAYYQSILITLSDQARYQILDSITVFEFCERVARFNEYAKALEDKQNTIKGK